MMKHKFWMMILMLAGLGLGLEAQEKGEVSAGADLVSTYVWRGTQYGNGPALQPSLEYSFGGFTAGAWGSYSMTGDGFMEADLFVSYAFNAGLSLGLTKYYFPEADFFEGQNHAWEINAGFEKGIVSLMANYILNDGAGAAGSDVYVEAGITTGYVYWFVGAGNGWHTPDVEFDLCYVGLTIAKELRLSDQFALPIQTSAIVNPATKVFHLVAGITL